MVAKSLAICPDSEINRQVCAALNEDLLFIGDLTGTLIEPNKTIIAAIKTNQDMVLCGINWANQAFKLLDNTISITWNFKDGDYIKANETLCHISGNARKILTAERTAINFLQTLSATATTTFEIVSLVKSTKVKIMDTRKTVPGLRLAQKYAVVVGGGYNQRNGLYDGVLIKENHIMSCGGITQALNQANSMIAKEVSIQIEVENFTEFKQALSAGATNILLDNMSLGQVSECVKFNNTRAVLEISGGVNKENILKYAQTGVDRISVGALTKNIKAIDLSLRVIQY
ncbi:MAG: carboxylating nicotinate-nucleotide diphosphorylase [Burkholderiales bacterium]|nr:carboxylating nicotinate-nucleotide diphosphorylase [Burkholderiales bacterium]